MSIDLERDYIHKEISKLKAPARLLEFGCGQDTFCNRALVLGHEVAAVDLFDRTDTGELDRFTFIKGDLEYLALPHDYFDCIYGISSFEHIGLEQNGLLPEEEVIKKVDSILKTMRRILKPNGILLLTFRFGHGGFMYVNPEGPARSRRPDTIWGARVYDANALYDVFKRKAGFLFVEALFLIKIGDDFFDSKSWRLSINPMDCYSAKDALVFLKLLSP